MAYSGFRKIIDHIIGHGMRGPGLGKLIMPVDPVNIFAVIKILIVAYFVLHPQADEHNRHDSDGQTDYIDHSITFVEKVSEGNPEI